MKKITAFALVGVVALSMIGCSYTAPLAVTSNPVSIKMGESKARFLFGFIPLGNADYSIYEAAKDGGITEISTVDVKVRTGLFVRTYTTIISGN